MPPKEKEKFFGIEIDSSSSQFNSIKLNPVIDDSEFKFPE